MYLLVFRVDLNECSGAPWTQYFIKCVKDAYEVRILSPLVGKHNNENIHEKKIQMCTHLISIICVQSKMNKMQIWK